MAAFYPMLDWARTGEVGVGPYSAAVMVAAGIWFSAFVCNLFFMDLPVEGEPLELLEYFRGGFAVDRAGLAGGALWCAGTVASFAVDRAGPRAAREAGRAAWSQSVPLIAALWGILFWREFQQAGQPRASIWLTLLLFAAGLALLALALPASGLTN